jgi:hypothetical protein
MQQQNQEEVERKAKKLARENFEVKKATVGSGHIHITDPCYTEGTWCAMWNLPALAGRWAGIATKENIPSWGERVTELEAYHTTATPATDWQRLPGEVGVDSGQAGIFDATGYTGDERDDATDDIYDPFNNYGRCCITTLSEKQWGIIETGIVSSSGLGDGGYKAYAKMNESGLIVAVKIVFIEEEEEEE